MYTDLLNKKVKMARLLSIIKIHLTNYIRSLENGEGILRTENQRMLSILQIINVNEIYN